MDDADSAYTQTAKLAGFDIEAFEVGPVYVCRLVDLPKANWRSLGFPVQRDSEEVLSSLAEFRAEVIEALTAENVALRAQNEALMAEVALLRPSVVAGLSRGDVLARAVRAEEARWA